LLRKTRLIIFPALNLLTLSTLGEIVIFVLYSNPEISDNLVFYLRRKTIQHHTLSTLFLVGGLVISIEVRAREYTHLNISINIQRLIHRRGNKVRRLRAGKKIARLQDYKITRFLTLRSGLNL
jgi:hypothetical protein